MQSKVLTILLALLALLLGTLAAVQMKQKDLSTIFGAPPRKVGDELFTFDPNRITRVSLSSPDGRSATFRKRQGVWWMTKPKIDRADYRDLQRIVYFSRFLRINEVVERKKTDPAATGIRTPGPEAASFKVRLVDGTGHEVARYHLGRRSAWHYLDPKSGETSPTYFVRCGDSETQPYIYLCSAPDPIRPSVRQILDRGIGKLRDHRPFLFAPSTLARIEIRNPGGEIRVARHAPDQPWRITKPLESRTQPEAMARLLQGLSDLRATAIHDTGAVTIPPRPGTAAQLEITLRFFKSPSRPAPAATGSPPSPEEKPGEASAGAGETSAGAGEPAGPLPARPSGGEAPLQDHHVTLTVEPPATASATTTFARINNRPGTIFELSLVPIKGSVTLSELPLAVDELRSRNLTSLNIAALKSITIHDERLSHPIRLTLGRERLSGKLRWMVAGPDGPRPANEFAIGALIEAISRDEVGGFASDAASNLAAYGLAPPHKRIVIEGLDNQKLELLFGQSDEGKFYAMRAGSSTVATIDAGTYASIATRPHEWRDTLLMPFPIIDLAALKIERKVRPPLASPALTLNYDFIMEEWTARQFGRDATPRLIVRRANKFIHDLDDLRVVRWLGPDSSEARNTLRNPVYRLTAAYRINDAEGNQAGLREVTLEIARASQSATNKYYYGRLSGDPDYFLLNLEAARILAEPLVESE